MTPISRRASLLVATLFVGLLSRFAVAQEATPMPIPTALQDYVALADASFAWTLQGKTENPLGTIYDIELTSQTWHDITWKHVLMVYEPKDLAHKDHVLLFITGGSRLNKPKPQDQLLGLEVARLCGSRVAMLHQVPNQPLFENRVEDDLITDTMLKYLATGDKTWPLLFPMVKSAVRAMDAVEQLAVKEWKVPVKGFVVTGASKRGWTTWLSAVADKRVVGIAPIVIDTLNFPKQTDYQIETWGKYSEQIDDYTSKGLIAKMKDDPKIPLWTWVDPYTYRHQLTLPKLIINGTNDRYWTVDALNNYWSDLEGPKHIRYVPNGGHNLGNGKEGALKTLGAFVRHTVSGRPLPKLEWKHSTAGGKYVLTMSATPAPKAISLWSSASATKDFREVEWRSQPLNVENGAATGELTIPASGHAALFGEFQFQEGDLEYSLSTQIRRE